MDFETFKVTIEIFNEKTTTYKTENLQADPVRVTTDNIIEISV